VCFLTDTSLRRHKSFYLDLAGMRKHMTKRTVGTTPVGLNKSTVLTEKVKLPHIKFVSWGSSKMRQEWIIILSWLPMRHHLDCAHAGGWKSWLKYMNLKGDWMALLLLPWMDCLLPLLTTTLFSKSISKLCRKRPTSSRGTMMWMCTIPLIPHPVLSW
jgi:hypothetical protein